MTGFLCMLAPTSTWLWEDYLLTARSSKRLFVGTRTLPRTATHGKERLHGDANTHTRTRTHTDTRHDETGASQQLRLLPRGDAVKPWRTPTTPRPAAAHAASHAT